MTDEQMKARIAELEDERDALKVQVHDLNWALGTPGYEQLHNPEDQQAHEAAIAGTQSIIKRLAYAKAEHDAMELDAKRYRWLRDGCDHKGGEANRIVTREYGGDWDAAIDAAMNQPKDRQ